VLFNSPIFLFIFLPATVAAYIVLRDWAGPRAVLGFLVAASVVFYGWWNPYYVPLLGGIAVFNFGVARAITAQRRAGRADRVSVLLTFGIVSDLAVLGYFKYTDFLIDTANQLLQTDLMLRNIVLPLGISFFTFQKIAYLVDTSRGDVIEHDFLEYCFFAMFFPQLLAGPITHHSEIFSQTKGPWAFAIKPSNFVIGLTIFVIGLFKKVVLADRFALYVPPAYDAAAAGQTIDFFLAWQSALAFKFQLYFDFSGYSEMALGSARLFGIQLPLNFNSPYRGLNVVDYWRRWHMTLSRFLRDYIYIPLGGSRRGTPRLYFNLMVTMALSGLWHGAAWHFVLWGALQGGAMVVNHAWRSLWPPVNTWWSWTIARLVTFVVLTIILVLHRAPSVEVASRIFAGMVNLPGSWHDAFGPFGDALGWLGVRFDGQPISPDQLALVPWLIAWIAFMWYMPNTQQLLARWHPAFNYGVAERRRDPPVLARIPSLAPLLEWRPNAVVAAIVGILAALALLSLGHVSEFLYFKF
jgi:D-alanyl-lipoteichoic acid acyltransferase DltB (MBOAT superfamily)